jgi:3-oxoacyl-[acyl-carrier protein] reductase
MSMQLSGKVAVITGAGRGIGRAIAGAYAAEGAAVVCAARHADQIEATAEAVTSDGGRALAVPANVTDPEAMEELFDAAVRGFGGIDIVVGNAGYTGRNARVADSDPSNWRTAIDVNLFGAYLTARQAIPHLRQRGGGKIILVGSGAARPPAPGLSAYGASKAGVVQLVRVLAVELRRDRIAVNELLPGPTYTLMTGFADERAPADADDLGHLRGQAIGDEWFKEPHEVGPLAVFMAALPDDGPTGQVFSLHGRIL